MHVSVVSILGNHLDQMPALFKDLGYTVQLPPRALSKHDIASLRLLGTGEMHEKIVYHAHSWTHIVDMELALMFDHQFWKKWSAKLETTVVGWIAESSSLGYGFNVFYNGNLAREVLRVGNTCAEFGERLPPERTTQWSNAREDQILAVVSRIGATFDQLRRTVFIIYSMMEGT